MRPRFLPSPARPRVARRVSVSCNSFSAACARASVGIGAMRPDRSVLEVARRQRGAILTPQLRATGLTDEAIRHRVKQGWLRRVHRGVYLAGALETPWSRAMAAVLAYGGGALLSDYPAAVRWGVRPPPMGALHVDGGGSGHAEPATVLLSTQRPLVASHRRHPPRRACPSPHPPGPSSIWPPPSRSASSTEPSTKPDIQHLVTDRSLNEQFSRYPTHRGTSPLKNATTHEPKLTRSKPSGGSGAHRKARLPEPRTNTSRPPQGRPPGPPTR